MVIIARAVGRRKEAVAQVQMIRGTGKFIINTKAAHEYLQNDSCAILAVQAPFEIFKLGKNGSLKIEGQTGHSLEQVQDDGRSPQNNSLSQSPETVAQTTLSTVDTLVTVKGGGLKGQTEAIRLGIARALCVLDTSEYSTETSTVPAVLKDTSALSAEKKQQSILTNASTQNVGLRKQLKDKGYLTQDARVKERKKYGLKKARKASQYHKR